MSDQVEQTPERDETAAAFQEIRQMLDGYIRESLSDPDLIGQSRDFRAGYEKGTRELFVVAIRTVMVKQESALRSAEARGRVQGLREAAEEVARKPLAFKSRDVAALVWAWLRKRADAIEQEQPK